jgi:predicted NAD/FAD-binding protein
MALDNGQHIMLGAYVETLALMRAVGVDIDTVLLRTPLTLVDARGDGFLLRTGPALPALLRAIVTRRGWRVRDRAALLFRAAGWLARGFRCDPRLDVASWSAPLPDAVRRELIEPLAIAALNTPVEQASASAFLRVLRDALFSGPGSADLLLPRATLSELLPIPAQQWLREHGAVVRCAERVQRIGARDNRWLVDDVAFDAVVLAVSPVEAARLAAPIARSWAALAAALRHQPIATVYLLGDRATAWPAPMLALHSDDSRWPAQFAFDMEALGRDTGLFAFVVSAAAGWVERGVPALEAAVLAQARTILPGRWEVLRTLIDRRATFACTPGLVRPPQIVDAGLHAAGDYVDGPYPGTLEGAVRSGITAVPASLP